MIDAALADHLRDGPSLVVATVAPDGRPHASRAWGVVPLDETRLRIFLDATDATALANAAATGAMSMTSANVHTYRSFQFKGAVELVGEATPQDLDDARAYAELLTEAIHKADNLSAAALDRWRAVRFVPCVLHVEQVFDQSPGPGAGRVLPGAQQ